MNENTAERRGEKDGTDASNCPPLYMSQCLGWGVRKNAAEEPEPEPSNNTHL
jgi:hypothetical protein